MPGLAPARLGAGSRREAEVAQLYAVVRKMTVQNGRELPSHTGAVVTLPAGF
jgi:hypothetical protein